MTWLRVLFWLTTAFWSIWFIISTWALYSEFGTIVPPGPVEAHDEYDLLFWAALVTWTYAPPVLLLVAGLRHRTARFHQRNG
jgi:hypothetical protein